VGVVFPVDFVIFMRSRSLESFGTTPRHDEGELSVSRGTTRVDSVADFSVLQREGVGGVIAPGGPSNGGHGAGKRCRAGLFVVVSSERSRVGFDFSAAFDSSESARTAWETLVSGGLMPATMSRPGSVGSVSSLVASGTVFVGTGTRADGVMCDCPQATRPVQLLLVTLRQCWVG
jgi:hypothetical protein